MTGIVLHPIEPAIEAQQLDALIDLYLQSIEVDPVTIVGYRNGLRHFRRWWAFYAPPHKYRLTPSAITAFARHLHDTGLALETRRAIHTRLGQMFHWALKTNRINIDASSWIPPAKGYKRERAITADVATFGALLDAALETETPEQSQAIMAVLIGTGMRSNECVTLELGGVRFMADCSGTMFIAQAKRVRDRDIAQRVVAFDAATGRILRPWIDSLSTGETWLFPSPVKLGYPLDRRHVLRTVVRCAALADVTSIKNAHDVRRAYTTFMRRTYTGQSHFHLLQRQLGHTPKGSVTDTYTFLNADDIRQTLLSPVHYVFAGRTQPKT